MCRLFGFRSVIPSQVHQSLVSADNALIQQSQSNPHGWGVAYYVADVPHVVKSAEGAFADRLFKHVSGVVASNTVVAHIRLATNGTKSIINSHPFQYGKWIFAHNGNIPDFDEHRAQIEAKIPPVLRRYILGETDSEVFFYLLLSNMSRLFDLHRKGFPLDDLKVAIRQTVKEIEELIGESCFDENKLFLTFIITNGQTMAAHQGGKELMVSTYKSKCSEKNTCPNFAPECISPSQTGFISHLIFASEVLDGDNVWRAMEPGEIIGVDWRMRLAVFHPDEKSEVVEKTHV